jgi:hypothetical protein
MIKKMDVTLKPLTPETLTEFERAKPLPGERPLNPTRLRQLLQLIVADDFYGVDWHVAIDEETGELYRTDGQHTAALLRQLLNTDRSDPAHADDPPFPEGLLATVTTWRFTSVSEDASDLFNMFNNPMSVRTNTDMLAVFRAQFPDLAEQPLPLLHSLLGGVAHAFKELNSSIIVGFAGPHLAIPQRRFNGMLLYHEGVRRFVIWAAQFADSRNRHFLKKAGIVASVLENWIEDSTDATPWWTLVLNESHPDPDDDSRDLAEQLKRLAGGPRKSFSEDFHTKCSRAWRKRRKAAAPSVAA